MKTIKLAVLAIVALGLSSLLAACGSSGQAQMTPEKFRDMYGMVVKRAEMKKKEIITDDQCQLPKKYMQG